MLIRRTPLKPKGKNKSAAMKRHHGRVAAAGCVVCKSPAEVHHVTGFADRMGRISPDDRFVIGLCPLHHRGVLEKMNAQVSVQALGHRGFFQEHGIDLLAEAEKLWAASEEAERKAA